MKRVISALLSVLLLGCLTACSRDDGQSKNGDSRSGTLKAAIGETNTDFDGVSVRILNLAEDEGKTQLNVSWVNKTFYEVVMKWFMGKATILSVSRTVNGRAVQSTVSTLLP